MIYPSDVLQKVGAGLSRLKVMASVRNSFLAMLAVLISVEAHAARDLFIRNTEVVSVAVLYDGARNVVQVRFRASPENVDAASLTCAQT
ncbi:MAG TPA: hypothetical protein DEP04_11775 [Dehalococcoidia bacterium]|nr:hypothetical protein [Dehalococcoidia bacterium]